MPDFIIGGAMKSGTSTMHYVLAQHPNVFVPDQEIAFFDLDDVEQHADFFRAPDGSLRGVDLDERWDPYFADYRRLFEGAGAGQVVGEDSTTYLASDRAPERIAEVLPDVRLIFLLRDPVERALSHYWHLVRTFRMTRPLEDAVRIEPRQILARSSYRDGLRRYRSLFPDDQVLVLPFERFITEMQTSYDEVLAFLGLEPMDLSGRRTHINASRYPRWPRLQRLYNRLTHPLRPGRFRPDRVPGSVDPYRGHRWLGALDHLMNHVNLYDLERPAAPPGARALLRRELCERNDGLEELVSFSPARWWPSWREGT